MPTSRSRPRPSVRSGPSSTGAARVTTSDCSPTSEVGRDPVASHAHGWRMHGALPDQPDHAAADDLRGPGQGQADDLQGHGLVQRMAPADGGGTAQEGTSDGTG